jgi:DNA-binding CsgD family transcriptional regulator
LVDLLSVTLTGVLLAITAGAAIEYYRLIRKAQFEYQKARELVEDVVLSFNRELRRETNKLDTVAFKIQGNTSKIDVAIKRVENVEKRIAPIDNQLSTVLGENQRVAAALTETSAKMRDIEVSNEVLKAKVADLQEQVQKFSAAPELKIEPVIPIKRDKAMAALTDTEIAVLEMLAAEGAKTAPEIKERVQLSREHTARLMKKLYEEGYLERETEKIPFKYKIKKEMERLLKKPENAQA